MESQNILDPLTGLHPPKRMIEILAMPDKKERNRQTALWACEFGFDELRPKALPTTPDKVKGYRALDKKERWRMNNDPDKYYKFWTDESVKKYFSGCDFVKISNRQNKKWLETLKSWLDPTRDPKELKMITDRLYDFGNMDQPQEADWSEKENE